MCINRRYCLKCVDSGVASCGESPARVGKRRHWMEKLGQWIQWLQEPQRSVTPVQKLSPRVSDTSSLIYGSIADKDGVERHSRADKF